MWYVCLIRSIRMLLRFDVFFFFFNQKTAYEMRISDWSSDVCSSDLPRQRGRPDPLAWKRHRPTPPPGHPMRLSYGWPGGGVGRCRTRFSGAESDSSTPPPLPTSPPAAIRSEEHTSELQSLMRISYAVFCLQKKK